MTNIVRQKTDPTLADVLNALKKDIKLEINCHAIGTVEEFNSSDQTITAKIVYKQTYMERQNSGTYIPVAKDYPLLVDCPMLNLYGGNGGLTMPIQKGDTCLILFNDRDMDNWFGGGNNSPPQTSRLHSFSDGIALVGIRSLQSKLASYDAARVVLYKGDTKVALGTKVNVQNASENLATILQDLINAIKAITVTGVTSGGSSSGPPANVATFTAIATRLQGLLE